MPVDREETPMKAAVIEGPGRLAVRELPQPRIGDYQALCQLLYGAVCSGTDNHLVAGHQPFCRWFQAPAILGHESIGRVVDVGAKVRTHRPGDLITRVGSPPVGGVNAAWGGFAQYGVATDWQAMKIDGLPASQWTSATAQHVLPANLDPARATMIITWRETWSFLSRMGFRAGQNLLVVGSGGTGLSFAAHGVNAGAAAVVVCGSAGRRREIASLGGAFVDYKDDRRAEAAGEAGGEGFDAIVDAVGKTDALNPYLGLLKPGGTVAVYGLDDAMTFRLNPLAARGTFTFYKGGQDEAESHDAVVEFVRQGKLDAGAFLTNLDAPYALEQIGDALAAVRERRAVKALVKLT
jgi:2-desacetyl-2-hydroxyethyl bacteriochlorophyllide A dehydrogenase